jgi:asparagine synthase (glutamine-hydrolysing)
MINDVALGHTRLSIIDLSSRGNQPMRDKEEKVIISYNGEIYNFRQLREELVSKGYRFTSETDTEVLIQGYRQWGIRGLLDKIEGMFAFCLYDKKRDILFAVRDRMGMKPLYYSYTDSSIIISSEIKSILHLLDNYCLDDLSMYTHLFYLRNRIGSKTIFKNVKELLPGQILEYDVKKKAIRRLVNYFDIFTLINKETYQKSAIQPLRKNLESLTRMIEESVHRHLISDVPVGVLYSGGLDSSVVATLAGRNSSQLYLLHSEADSFKESTRYANILASRYHYDLILCKQKTDCLPLLPQHIFHFETICLRSDLAYSFLCKRAKELGVKVLLSGDAADEIFGGYDIYQILYRDYKHNQKLHSSLDVLLMSGHSDFNKLKRPLDFIFFGGTRQDRWSRCLESYDFVKRKKERISLAYMLENISGNLVSKFLHRGDRAGMMHSVEVRLPYLYLPLVAFCLNLAFKHKIYQQRTLEPKHLLKVLAKRIAIPSSIIKRRKIGMVTSFEKDLKKLIPLLKRSIFREYLSLDSNVFDQYIHMDNFYLWTFLNYEILMRIFIQKESPENISEDIRQCLFKRSVHF